MAMLVNATLPSGEVHGHLSGELRDPLLEHEGREKERENLRKFGVYEQTKRGRIGLCQIQTCNHAASMGNTKRIASRRLLLCVV